MNDANGNPDVMGSRPMSPQQIADADELRLAFNALHALIEKHASTLPKPEAGRMFSVAKTHLELACMAAVKGISRT